MKTQRINHAAVWTMVFVFQALSVLWFSPAVFADTWMAYLGKTFDDFKSESMSGLIFSLAGAVCYCYFVAWLQIRIGITKAMHGLFLGLGLAFVCFVLQTATQDSFSLRPPGLTAINSGVIIINFSLAGFVLGRWRKYKTI